MQPRGPENSQSSQSASASLVQSLKVCASLPGIVLCSFKCDTRNIQIVYSTHKSEEEKS